MDYSKIITIEPGKRSGKPSIRGTRMRVTDVLEYLAGGMSEEEILADFPDLTKEDLRPASHSQPISVPLSNSQLLAAPSQGSA